MMQKCNPKVCSQYLSSPTAGHIFLQMAWLRADLAAVDRSRTPWLIVGMHAPWYNSNAAHWGEVEDMRRSMEGLLYSYGVDLVFAGERAPSS